MLTAELDYNLPPDRIAQQPIEPRDHARLLVCDRRTRSHQHRYFYELPDLLQAGDLLVANDTSVINARIRAQKPTGGRAEVLLLRKLDERHWEAMVGGRNVRELLFPLPEGGALRASVEPMPGRAEGVFQVRFDQPVEPFLDRLGEVPLPPYIHAQLQDPSRYQTVYARVAGSAAAPTAGLHFTPQLIDCLRQKGVRFAFVTLHVGLDTFKPITEATVEEHVIHSEWCRLSLEVAAEIARTKAAGGRVIAVGTTSARVLETAAQTPNGAVAPFEGFTSLYITPGYQWRAVDALITNFHLPRSTLLAMVGAFMGLDWLKQTYALAIAEGYRFYSFGDAMLIL